MAIKKRTICRDVFTHTGCIIDHATELGARVCALGMTPATARPVTRKKKRRKPQGRRTPNLTPNDDKELFAAHVIGKTPISLVARSHKMSVNTVNRAIMRHAHVRFPGKKFKTLGEIRERFERAGKVSK